jgi:predicted O-methyltransferase YrrM
MEHFWEQIPGWSHDTIGQYRAAVETATDGAHFVEVGSWKGRSAAFMAVEIMNSGKQIQFDCVDHFLGNIEQREPKSVGYDADTGEGRLQTVFTQNMLPVAAYYNAVVQTSPEAAQQYADGSLDFVFIDASRDYDSVKADILGWWPKVKPGGLLAGHDIRHPPVEQALKDTEATTGRFISKFWDCWEITKPV